MHIRVCVCVRGRVQAPGRDDNRVTPGSAARDGLHSLVRPRHDTLLASPRLLLPGPCSSSPSCALAGGRCPYNEPLSTKIRSLLASLCMAQDLNSGCETRQIVLDCILEDGQHNNSERKHDLLRLAVQCTRTLISTNLKLCGS